MSGEDNSEENNTNEPAKKPQLKAVPPPPPKDAVDIDSLWLDPGLGDGITDTNFHGVTVDKPKDFFRTHPDKGYRRRCEIYTHKIEGVVGEAHYVVGPRMQGRIPEARPCTLACVIYRDGTPRLWPLKLPREGEKDNDAWKAARAAAKTGLTKWIKLFWVSRSYVTRDAPEGYAPDPDWKQLPSFNELVRLAFGEHGIIQDEKHPIYRELFGLKKSDGVEDDGDEL
jgi:hypothetical protein